MNKKSTLRSVANDYLTHPKNQRGITLIALVVTIIVLIILAGISINLLLGDNGLISRAKSAAVQQVIAEKKEAVALALQEEFIAERGVASNITVEGLLKELQTSQKSTVIYALKDVNGTETPITATQGNTPLGCKVVFPKEITGAAKADVIVTVDEYGKVTNVTTDDEGETPPTTSYTITYDKNDANATGTMNPTTGAAPQVAANGFTAPAGKQFKEWNRQANGEGQAVAVGTTLNANTTLYAQWENETISTQWILDADNDSSGTLTKGDLIRPNLASSHYLANEKFYVIGTEGTGADQKVILLAGKNVETSSSTETENIQYNYAHAVGFRMGVSGNEENLNVYEYSTIKGLVDSYASKLIAAGLTLEDVEVEEGGNNVSGVKGRLLWGTETTGEYASLLSEGFSSLLWNGTDTSGYGLNYWLGSAHPTLNYCAMCVEHSSGITSCQVYSDSYYRVRPVIKVKTARISISQ